MDECVRFQVGLHVEGVHIVVELLVSFEWYKVTIREIPSVGFYACTSFVRHEDDGEHGLVRRLCLQLFVNTFNLAMCFFERR